MQHAWQLSAHMEYSYFDIVLENHLLLEPVGDLKNVLLVFMESQIFSLENAVLFSVIQ